MHTLPRMQPDVRTPVFGLASFQSIVPKPVFAVCIEDSKQAAVSTVSREGSKEISKAGVQLRYHANVERKMPHCFGP